MQCPRCSAEAREIARFCPRCHATLRYKCPSCRHEQRHGGTCEKCSVDFLKFLTAVVASKCAATDAIHDRVERQSALLKNILLFPLTMGIPLIRSMVSGGKGN